jgi:DNA polymerase
MLPDGNPRLYSGGAMPIPLRYGGAHTHRLSGDWRMNMQNMPTVRGSKGKSKLRLSLKAPPGHTVLTCDLGQIEARLSAWMCGANSLIEQFAKYDAGDKSFDPYNRLASEIFGRPVDRKLSGPDEIMGFIGKTGILGLGYGCGKDNFHAMVIRNARAQCMDISQIYSRDIGDKAVDIYRGTFHQLPAGWKTLNHYIANYWLPPGGNNTVQFGPVTIGHGYVLLPSGMKLEYAEPKLVWTADEQGVGGRWEYSYRYGKCWHRLYGAKLLENITQALARIVVMDAALRIRAAGRYRPCPWAYCFVLQAHDELVFIVPDEELKEAKRIIHQEMVRRPSWGPDIPLVAEIGAGNSYGAAK